MHPSLGSMPLVAILRGIRPGEAAAVGDALAEAGLRILEVPMNSPEPLRSIEVLAKRLPRCLVGAGTVLQAGQVAAVRDAGGQLVVAPNLDAEVVGASLAAGLIPMPGVATPTEAFAALAAGAPCLKVFPAEGIPPAVLKAWRAVLPARVPLLPVGGITAESMGDYLAAGASGFGLGSALYRAGDDPATVGERAMRFVSTWQALHGRLVT
jgi:2-dehydro-3-deoxyphosphogalactonate aldolase